MYTYTAVRQLGFVFLVSILGVSFGQTADALNTSSVDFERNNDQFLFVSDSSDLRLSNDFTIEIWVNAESWNVGSGTAFISKDDTNAGWSLYVQSGGINPNWQSGGSNGNDHLFNPITLNTGTWYHFAVTQSSGMIKAYINGAEYLNTSYTDHTNSVGDLRIGKFVNQAGRQFDGLIDDVRVWNVARTEGEIVANMDKELAGNEPGLVAYWKFNGESLEDATANNNDLTNHNGVTFSTDVPFVGEVEIDPVIVIPGILGSTQKGNDWIIDPILHTYDDLIATLDENGYTPGEDLFTFGYDWRNSNVATADLLKEKIDEVKEACACTKVDLVAHSMGGLVARQYLQSDVYENDVDQLIFLGTPHRGAPKAYLMWEGGEFVTPSVFDRLTGKFLRGDARKHGYASVFEYLREHPVAAVEELLPEYSYLFDASVLRTYSAGYPTNPFLESLNADLQTLLDAGSTLYSFVGDDHSTITGLDVVSAPEQAPKWEHGYPEDFTDTDTDRGLVFGAGDQTVPITSASFVNENLTSIDAKHNAIPEAAAGDIVAILRGAPATTVVDNWNVPNIRVLLFQMFSPANMLITDPAGKKIGTLANGTDINEIHGAFYAGPTVEREIITIPNPLAGFYTIEVRGTGRGAYAFESSFLTDEEEDVVSRSGMTAPGQSTVYRVNLAGGEALKIAATIASTLADLEYAYQRQWVDRSAYQSLKAKLTSAQMGERINARGVRAILENIQRELERRRGSSVTPEAYNLLIEDVRSLLNV